MKVFLDTSVLLSASGSAKGASRYKVDEAKRRRWSLCSSRFCREEVRHNLPKLSKEASVFFESKLNRRITWIKDTVVADRAVLFEKTKDKPVLLTALASESDVLLTLDREDFHGKLGNQFYGLAIRTPGDWLTELRQKNLI